MADKKHGNNLCCVSIRNTTDVNCNVFIIIDPFLIWFHFKIQFFSINICKLDVKLLGNSLSTSRYNLVDLSRKTRDI